MRACRRSVSWRLRATPPPSRVRPDRSRLEPARHRRRASASPLFQRLASRTAATSRPGVHQIGSLATFALPWHAPVDRGERRRFRCPGWSTPTIRRVGPGRRHVIDRGGQFIGPTRPSLSGGGQRMRGRTTSAVWVKGIASVLAAEGLDVRSLLAAAAIDPAALDDPFARVSTEKISRLWEVAAEQSGNPAIGLAQHLVARPASFDVVGYTMMSCANLLGALERLIRYLLILSDALTMTLSEERGGHRVTFELFGGNRPVPRQRVEFILVSVIGFCHWISGRELHPLSIELPYPTPVDPAHYCDAFGCRVSFDAASTSMLFADADLRVPLPTS